jgi:hypothetical protein
LIQCALGAFALAAFGLYIVYALGIVLYPTELEGREGTYWLHALALANGINIFDFTKQVYVNAGHGILDHVLKAALITVAPFLPGSVVLRIFALVFPPVLAATFYAAAQSARSVASRLITALLLAAATTTLLHLVGFWYTCLGRSDATAFVLFTLGFLAGTPALTTRFPRLAPAASAMCVALLLFTNWRIAPVAALLPLLHMTDLKRESWRHLLRFALVTTGFAIALGILFVWGWFDGKPGVFVRYFIGFFTGASGWSNHVSVPLTVLLHEIQEPAVFVLIAASSIPFVIAVVGCCWKRERSGGTLIPSAALLLGLLICAAALKSNFRAGGFWYFCPSVLLLFFFAVARFRIGPGTAAGLAVIAFALVWASPFTSSFLYFGIEPFRSARAAADYMHTLRILDKRFGIASDELHLFRRNPPFPKVDMGDTAEVISKSGFLGRDFTRTFEDYSARLATHPPAVILVGGFSSSVLRQLVDSGDYQLLASGPPPRAVGKVYVRRDCLAEARSEMEIHKADPR